MKILGIDLDNLKSFFIIFGIIFLVNILDNLLIIYGRGIFVSPFIGFLVITFVVSLISALIIKLSGKLR